MQTCLRVMEGEGVCGRLGIGGNLLSVHFYYRWENNNPEMGGSFFSLQELCVGMEHVEKKASAENVKIC